MFFVGKGNNCSATTSATLLGEVEVKLPLQKEAMNFLSQFGLQDKLTTCLRIILLNKQKKENT